MKKLHLLLTLSLAAVTFGCGDSDNSSTPETIDADELLNTEIPNPHQHDFDVEWKSDVKHASFVDLRTEIVTYSPAGSWFDFTSDSATLSSLSQGDIVVWEQFGAFRIEAIAPGSDTTRVTVSEATITEIVDRADISFAYDFQQDADLVVGVAANPETTQAGALKQGLNLDKNTFTFSSNEVTASGENWQTKIGLDGQSATIEFESSNGAFASYVNADVVGLGIEGNIQVAPGTDDVVAEIHVRNVHLLGDMGVRFERAEGDAELTPPARLVFPFMLGPIPVYISIEIRVAVEATLAAEIEIITGFEFEGSTSLYKDAEGFRAEGITEKARVFDQGFDFDPAFTAGTRIDADMPRVSFGVGHPAAATLGVYTTFSAETIANIEFNAFAEEDEPYCLNADLNTAVTYGGTLTFLHWTYDTVSILPGAGAEIYDDRGDLCD